MRLSLICLIPLVLTTLGAEEYTLDLEQFVKRMEADLERQKVGSRGETLTPDQLNVDTGGKDTIPPQFRPKPGHELKIPTKHNVTPATWRYIVVDGTLNAAGKPPKLAIKIPAIPFAEKAGEAATEKLTWSAAVPVDSKVTLELKDLPAEPHLVAVTWFEASAAEEYWIALGTSLEWSELWLNGKLEYASANQRRKYRADQWVAPLKFKAGHNLVIIVAKLDPDKPTSFSLIALTASE